MRSNKRDWFRILVHVMALAPLAALIWDIVQDQLSFNPIQDITARTGRTALSLLLAALACTPANTLFGFRRALTVRRALGLYAFLYAGLHFLTFTVLDYGLDLVQIGNTIAEKRYVLVGFAAFLILLPMAITSTRGWMKRLGKRWRSLHRLIYLAAPLAVIHFAWLVKSDIREPLRFGAVVIALLALRLPPVRRAISSFRNRLAGLFAGARSPGMDTVRKAPALPNRTEDPPGDCPHLRCSASASPRTPARTRALSHLGNLQRPSS